MLRCWVCWCRPTWFVTFYLGAGRRWLAWTVSGLRVFYLLVAFLIWGNVNYLEITSLRRVPFLGDSVTVFEGIRNPWMLFGYATMVLILIFVADASVTAWRRGERRKALMIGGSVEFFLLLGTVQAALVHWAQLPIPVLISPFYLGLVVVMAAALSRDVLRASRLVHELQASEAGLRESEARMSLAVDAADLGIWIRDLARNEIWASHKWRSCLASRRQSRSSSTSSCNGCTPMIAKASSRRTRWRSRVRMEANTRPNTG